MSAARSHIRRRIKSTDTYADSQSVSSSKLRRALISLSILLSALTIAASAPGTAHASQPDDKPTLLGVAIDNTWRDGLDTFTASAGRPPAIFQLFLPVDTLDWTDDSRHGIQDSTMGILTELQTRGMITYIEFEVVDIYAYNAGNHDVNLNAMTTTVVNWLHEDPARRVLMAPLPEPNNQSHWWGGDPVAFKIAYNKTRNAFIDAGATPQQMRFIFGVNGLANLAYPHPENGYADFYPGDDVVDIIGFAKHNRDDPTWRAYDEMYTMHIDEMHRTVSHTKPILVIQTASVEAGVNGEDRADWLADMFNGLLAEDQVIGAIYFDRDVFELGAQRDYRIVKDGALDPAVPPLYAKWSDPSQYEWIFDGRMEAWVANREATIPPPTVDGLPFSDISGSIFVDDIVWLAETGITRGCLTGTTFCPESRVIRQEMASFLERALGLPAGTSNYFTDDDDSIHEPDINALAESGITRGCDTDRYCPTAAVTREQMASFLVRALNLPTATTDFFTDDDDSVHEADINALAQSGITQGCGSGTYCPGSFVTREQMAAFLHRALG